MVLKRDADEDNGNSESPADESVLEPGAQAVLPHDIPDDGEHVQGFQHHEAEAGGEEEVNGDGHDRAQELEKKEGGLGLLHTARLGLITRHFYICLKNRKPIKEMCLKRGQSTIEEAAWANQSSLG